MAAPHVDVLLAAIEDLRAYCARFGLADQLGHGLGVSLDVYTQTRPTAAPAPKRSEKLTSARMTIVLVHCSGDRFSARTMFTRTRAARINSTAAPQIRERWYPLAEKNRENIRHMNTRYRKGCIVENEKQPGADSYPMKNDATETIEIRQDASAGSGVVRGLAWNLEYASIASTTGVMKLTSVLNTAVSASQVIPFDYGNLDRTRSDGKTE